MDNLLKSKISQASKTPVDKCVSADRDFSNTCTSMLAKQSCIGDINDKSPLYTTYALAREKRDKSNKHQFNIMGAMEHLTDTTGNKILINSEKISKPGRPADAVAACSSYVDGENYDEDESVFGDELVFDGGCLDYETSSVSVDIVTECVLSEESLTDDKPQKTANYNCNDGKLTLKLNTVGVSKNSDDESPSFVNAEHYFVKPSEEENLFQDKQSELSEALRLASKIDTLKLVIHLPEVHNNSSLSSSESAKYSNKAADFVAGDESLEQHQEMAVECKTLSLSKETALHSGVISRHDSDRLSVTSRSSDDTDWNLASLFENSGAVTPVNIDRTPKSCILPATSLDWHMRSSILPELFPSSVNNEVESDGKLRSPVSHNCSANSSKCHHRSGNYQESAAKDGEVSNSVIVPSPLLNLSCSHCSSDWHLASIFYEESACDNESGDIDSTARNLNSGQSSTNSSRSASCSEWHIGSLLFNLSDMSSRQLSGDLHA